MSAFFRTEEKRSKASALVLQPPVVSVVTSLADTKRGGGRLAWIFEGKLNIVAQRSDEMSALPPPLSFLSSGPSGRAGNRREC